MRKTPYVAKRIVVAAFLACSLSPFAKAQTLSLSNVTSDNSSSAPASGTWRGVVSPTGGYFYDTGGARTTTVVGVEDQQTANTNADSDIVGSSTVATFYIGTGTAAVSYTRTAPNSLSNVTGNSSTVTTTAVSSSSTPLMIGFRVRLNGFKDNLQALNQVTYIGFNLDGDSTADLYVGVDLQSQDETKWKVVITDAGTGTNLGPSTTTIPFAGDSSTVPLNGAYYTYSVGSSGTNNNKVFTSDSLVNYQQTTTSNYSSLPDAFLTFAVPYADFATAAQYVTGGATFTAETAFKLFAATSTQPNALNQDNMGSGDFVYSTPTNTSGTIGTSTVAPIPEPASVIVFGALMAPALAVVARRQWKKRSSANA
jgi:hypothetical protein